MMNREIDPRNETPAVTLDRITGNASFVFRGQKYDLPGKYAGLGDAQKAAEARCRALGWRG
ncbi:hypothetical protein ILFOPFJJ_01513 [Ensifer psoraleae]|nr:hypothetical protein [Sinorhizobium psoraleae]